MKKHYDKIVSGILFVTLIAWVFSPFSLFKTEYANAGGAYVQECHNQTSSTVVTCVFGSNIAAGSVILVMMGWSGSGTPTVSSLTDTIGNTYTLLDNATHGTGGSTAHGAMACAVSATGGANTLTITWSATSAGNTVNAVEVSGGNTAGCGGATLDGHKMTADAGGGCGTTADSATSGNITTTVDGDFIFGGIVIIDANTPAAGTNFTNRSIQTPSSAFVVGVGETKTANQTSAGSIAATFTPVAGAYCVVGVIALQPPASAASFSFSGFAYLGAPTFINAPVGIGTTIPQASTASSLLTTIVAYWKMDESGAVDRADATGRGNTLTGSFEPGSRAGIISNGVDNVPGSFNFFNPADNADFSMGTGVKFTIAGWFNSDVAPNYSYVFAKDNVGNGEYVFRMYGGGNNHMHFVISPYGGATDIESLVTISSGVNYFYAITYDGTNYCITINNNTKDCTAGGDTPDSTGAFEVGRSEGAGGGYWDGLIDEMGIWKRALTDAEITTLYNSGAGKQYPF